MTDPTAPSDDLAPDVPPNVPAEAPEAPHEGAEAPVEPTETLEPSGGRLLQAILAGLLLILAVVVGSAFLLTAANPRRGLPDSEREAFGSRLSAIDATIDEVTDAAATLATSGREVLTRARALDPAGADLAVATGIQASSDLTSLHEQLLALRAGLTAGIDRSRLDEADRTRIRTIDGAIAAAEALPDSWLTVVGSVTGPVDLVRAIQTHDASVVDATAAARADDLDGAISSLEDAQRALVPARAVRDAADAAGADVGTLDELMVRLDTYDDALRRLYLLLIASRGVVTDGIRDVYAEVEAAQASLPLNQDALDLIVSDLAGPAVTAALVTIEDQRAALADAVAARPDAGDG